MPCSYCTHAMFTPHNKASFWVQAHSHEMQMEEVTCFIILPSFASYSLECHSPSPSALHSALYLRMGTPPVASGSSNSTRAVLEYGSTLSIEGEDGVSGGGRGNNQWYVRQREERVSSSSGRVSRKLEIPRTPLSWLHKGEKGRPDSPLKGLLRTLISVETFILVPPLRCQSLKIHSPKSHIFSKQKGRPERSNKSILDAVLSLQSLPQSIPIHSVTTPAPVSKAPHRVDDLGTPEAPRVCCAVRQWAFSFGT